MLKRILVVFVVAYFLSLRVLFAQEAVSPGLTTSQLLKLKGQPYYQTEHLAKKTGEQIWLYTKKKVDKDVDEKRIIDKITNWPTLYRKTRTKTCEIGDVFVQISGNKVASVIPANKAQAYGPCVVEVLEEYLPLVDGRPIEGNKRTTQNTSFEKQSAF